MILGIESSCDDTSLALVQQGRELVGMKSLSQTEAHHKTGGVVPEVASREHSKAILPCFQALLQESGVNMKEVDAIAVTQEPGLIGSLLVGRTFAETLAMIWNKPLFRMNHIHGHIYSNWLERTVSEDFPKLILTVSGGHNDLYLMKGHGDFEKLGGTLDDAGGEAFDKVARMLGLGYPGGPLVEALAKEGNPKRFPLPKAKVAPCHFSFSGLKTAVRYLMQSPEYQKEERADLAASFQEALIQNFIQAIKQALELHPVKELHLVGGVSANQALRQALQHHFPELSVISPIKLSYCTDNGAMIACAGFWMNRHHEA